MTKEEIQQFIDEDINPGLEDHGGFLTACDLNEETMVLTVEMGGGCQGCASSVFTLKAVVDDMLKAQFPLLKEVKDITDHSAGSNPYYEG